MPGKFCLLCSGLGGGRLGCRCGVSLARRYGFAQPPEDAFYAVCFDGARIDRPDMDAAEERDTEASAKAEKDLEMNRLEQARREQIARALEEFQG